MNPLLILLAAVIGTAIIVWFANIFFGLFNLGLFDLIQSGFEYFSFLFGTQFSTVFVAMFGLGFVVLIARFIMSYVGENPGSPANK